MKDVGGRPTALTREVLDTAKDYLKNYDALGHIVPSVVGLCTLIRCSTSSAYKWCQDLETDDQREFSDILDEIKNAQHFALTNKGLAGDTNSVITKLMLTKHGYSDKQESNVNLNDYTNKSPDELARIIAEKEQAYAKAKEE